MQNGRVEVRHACTGMIAAQMYIMCEKTSWASDWLSKFKQLLFTITLSQYLSKPLKFHDTFDLLPLSKLTDPLMDNPRVGPQEPSLSKPEARFEYSDLSKRQCYGQCSGGACLHKFR